MWAALWAAHFLVQGFAPLEMTTPVSTSYDAGPLYLLLDHTPDAIDAVSHLGAD